MLSSSIQLDIEKAFKAYFTSINLFVARTIHAAHETDTELTGTFLQIIADLPDWTEMIIAAVVRVHFDLATVVKDPGSRAAATAQHQGAAAKIIELFCEQRYMEVFTALNKPASGPDARSWSGLGFIGWEAAKPEPDGTTETQIVTKLNYDFEVFLEPDPLLEVPPIP